MLSIIHLLLLMCTDHKQTELNLMHFLFLETQRSSNYNRIFFLSCRDQMDQATVLDDNHTICIFLQNPCLHSLRTLLRRLCKLIIESSDVIAIILPFHVSLYGTILILLSTSENLLGSNSEGCRLIIDFHRSTAHAYMATGQQNR